MTKASSDLRQSIEEIQTYQKNKKEHVERIQDERVTILAVGK
jgi:hypothetical protein